MHGISLTERNRAGEPGRTPSWDGIAWVRTCKCPASPGGRTEGCGTLAEPATAVSGRIFRTSRRTSKRTSEAAFSYAASRIFFVTFPDRRLRRLRRTPALRRLVAEARLSVDALVAPLFVKEGIDGPEPVASMPGVVQHTQESLRKEVGALADLGIPAVILFGVPERKDGSGSQA